MYKHWLFIIFFAALTFFSCRKDNFITSKDAVVRFSSDTLFFDTVFVSTGSVTEVVKLINGNDQKLRLSDIKLMGGSHSYFAINIDGTPGPQRQGLDLEAGDSLYIFVAVTIQPGAADLPFVVQDSIRGFQWRDQICSTAGMGSKCPFPAKRSDQRKYCVG